MKSDKIKEESSSTLHFPSAEFQMFSSMYSSRAPGMVSLHNDEQNDHGPGIYAVPVLPFMGPMPGFPAGNLIPVMYKIPIRSNPAGAVSEETSQEAQQQHGQQRQVVVRRFQFALQIDMILILKLAAVIFLFHQEGSRQRLILLILFASLIYLYQTGAFAPILRWLQRAGAPPQPPAVLRPENTPPVGQEQPNDRLPEGNPGAENQIEPTENGGPVENENQAEVGRGNGIDWWGLAKEIKLVVVGIVTSLFPGFHHHND